MPIKAKSVSEKLMIFSTPEPNSGCYLWLGAVNSSGYGDLRTGKSKHNLAHRVAWSQKNGPIPPGMVICHKCDNKLCVNADHLAVGTQSDNLADMVRKGRGRPFSAKNEEHPTCVFPNFVVEQIRRDPSPLRMLCEKYQISKSHAWRIRRGMSRSSPAEIPQDNTAVERR